MRIRYTPGIILLGILLVMPIVAGAAVSSEKQVHYHAVDITSAFNAPHMSVPKVYIFQAGRLVYESKKNSGPDDTALYAALSDKNSPTLKGTQSGESQSLHQLMAQKGIKIADLENVLVSLEFGKSMGYCPGCEDYFPILRKKLNSASEKVTWIHLYVEKNTYKANSAG